MSQENAYAYQSYVKKAFRIFTYFPLLSVTALTLIFLYIHHEHGFVSASIKSQIFISTIIGFCFLYLFNLKPVNDSEKALKKAKALRRIVVLGIILLSLITLVVNVY